MGEIKSDHENEIDTSGGLHDQIDQSKSRTRLGGRYKTDTI